MTVRAAHQMGRDSSILTCITRHFTWWYIILWKCFSERESLDLNLQEHRAVQTLLKCFQSHLHLNPRCRAFEELTVSHLVKTLCLLQNLRIHYGVHNSLSLILSWARWIWCTPLFFCICLRSILLLCSCLCWSLFLQGFLSGMLHMFSSFSCM